MPTRVPDVNGTDPVRLSRTGCWTIFRRVDVICFICVSVMKSPLVRYHQDCVAVWPRHSGNRSTRFSISISIVTRNGYLALLTGVKPHFIVRSRCLAMLAHCRVGGRPSSLRRGEILAATDLPVNVVSEVRSAVYFHAVFHPLLATARRSGVSAFSITARPG